MLLALLSLSIGVEILGPEIPGPESLGPAPAMAAPATAVPTGSNQQDAYRYFVHQGMAPVAAAGLVGNLDYESNGVSPTASQCGSSEVAPPKGYCGVGIAQWTWGQNSASTRWQDLVGLAKIEGDGGVSFGTTDPNEFPSLSVQEQFVWQELTTTYRSLLGRMQACATQAPLSAAIECATYAVQTGYEVPQNSADESASPGCASPPNFCTRLADAEAIYGAYAPPAAPQGLIVNAASSSAVRLSWQPAARAGWYGVLRNGRLVGTASTTGYTDRGVAAGASYAYTVEAANQTGLSNQSAVAPAATIPALPSLAASDATLTSAGGTVTLVASDPGATSFTYSYSASSGSRRIKGWAPGTPLTGRSGSLHLGFPPNDSGQPETYAVTAMGTNIRGTSGGEPATVKVTVAGRRSGKAVAATKSATAATGATTTSSVTGTPTCWCAIPAGSLLGGGLGGGHASGGESALAAPAVRGR